MGNGPSLNLLDLTLLKDEITFGFNAIWLNEKKMGFVPTYYSVADLLVAEDHHAQINAFKGSKIRFFPLERANLIRASEDVIFLLQLEVDPYPQFATDVTSRHLRREYGHIPRAPTRLSHGLSHRRS